MEAQSAPEEIIVDMLEEMQGIVNFFKNDPNAEVKNVFESVLQLSVIKDNVDAFIKHVRKIYPHFDYDQ